MMKFEFPLLLKEAVEYTGIILKINVFFVFYSV